MLFLVVNVTKVARSNKLAKKKEKNKKKLTTTRKLILNDSNQIVNVLVVLSLNPPLFALVSQQ